MEEIALGTYPIVEMLYFPEVTHTNPAGEERIIPANITLTGPEGTRIIPLDSD